MEKSSVYRHFTAGVVCFLVLIELGENQDHPKSRSQDPWFLEQPVWPPMPYSFGYRVRDLQGHEQYRKETSDGQRVSGSYGFWGPDGIFRHVDYVADDRGFRANVRTSEAGVADSNPADARYSVFPLSGRVPSLPGLPEPAAPYPPASLSLPNPSRTAVRAGIRDGDRPAVDSRSARRRPAPLPYEDPLVENKPAKVPIEPVGNLSADEYIDGFLPRFDANHGQIGSRPVNVHRDETSSGVGDSRYANKRIGSSPESKTVDGVGRKSWRDSSLFSSSKTYPHNQQDEDDLQQRQLPPDIGLKTLAKPKAKVYITNDPLSTTFSRSGSDEKDRNRTQINGPSNDVSSGSVKGFRENQNRYLDKANTQFARGQSPANSGHQVGQSKIEYDDDNGEANGARTSSGGQASPYSPNSEAPKTGQHGSGEPFKHPIKTGHRDKDFGTSQFPVAPPVVIGQRRETGASTTNENYPPKRRPISTSQDDHLQWPHLRKPITGTFGPGDEQSSSSLKFDDDHQSLQSVGQQDTKEYTLFSPGDRPLMDHFVKPITYLYTNRMVDLRDRISLPEIADPDSSDENPSSLVNLPVVSDNSVVNRSLSSGQDSLDLPSLPLVSVDHSPLYSGENISEPMKSDEKSKREEPLSSYSLIVTTTGSPLLRPTWDQSRSSDMERESFTRKWFTLESQMGDLMKQPKK